MSDPIEFKGELSAVEFQPGDRFVLHSRHPLSMVSAQRLKEDWERFFAGGQVPPLLFLDHGFTLDIIRGRRSMKFRLNERVQLIDSGETGTVQGRAEYVACDPTYWVRYKAADGTQREQWWNEDALQAAPAKDEAGSDGG